MKLIFVVLILFVAIQSNQAAVLWNPQSSDSNLGIFGAMKRFFDALMEIETQDSKTKERFRKCLKNFAEKPLLMALCTTDRKMDGFSYNRHRGIN